VTLVENVDAEGRPVPDGEPGAKLLVTNLENRVQPIIRLAVADAAVIDPEPCACVRTLIRMRSVEGRSDDVLELPAGGDRTVAVYPLEFARITRDREVREFQVVRERSTIRILIVAANGARPELEARVPATLAERLAELGAGGIEVAVERRDSLARSAGGKLQLVVDRSSG
jgi:phenylacetate-CoA ligase